MYQIRLGLKDNLDVSLYVDEKYSWQQMSQIRKALNNGLDVSSYLDSNVSSLFMNISISNLLKESEKEKNEKNI